jgi:tRNA pseudouridine13 synthase
VEELPAYEPSGEGSHIFLRLRKRDRTTDDVVRAIARALEVDPREIGVAGLKDKVAVATQWISVPARDARDDERVRGLELDSVEILEAKRHGNKLRTGHLRGNRFSIVVRGVAAADVAPATSALERVAREGVPNAFGAQRFGVRGDTAEEARAWLTGKARAPRDARVRRFHFSALQSAIFNAVLAARVEDGSWTTPLDGDLLKKEDTGGIFLCADVQLDRERAARGEVCPTGPMVGDRMRQPERDALALEQRIVTPLIEGIDLKRARALGEGTRRNLRLRVTEMSVAVRDVRATPESDVRGAAGSDGNPSDPNQHKDRSAEELMKLTREQASAVEVRFVLPKGAYATTVLSNVFDVTEGDREELGTEEE